LRNSIQSMIQEYAGTSVIPFSARTGAGRDDLWQAIRSAVEGYRELHRA